MPKLKTHKGAKKRFKLTKNGKVLRMKGPRSHFRRRKPKRVKRLFGTKVELDNKTISRKIASII